MQPSTRKWFARGLRLSIVVGLASAAVHSWGVYSRHIKVQRDMLEIERILDCAAHLDDETLKKRVNERGHFNVGDLCVGGETFAVSPQEIAAAREGPIRFPPHTKPFDEIETLRWGLFGAIATILATAIILGVVGAVRWVWGSRHG
jgi:hypothetical protein